MRSMKSYIRYSLLAFFVGLVCFLFLDHYQHQQDRKKPKHFVIAGNEFLFPAGFRYQGYNSVSGYPALDFILDANSFEAVEPDHSSDRQIYVELRPLATEFGEQDYWTERDPVTFNRKIACVEKNEAKKTVVICDHEDKPVLISGGNNLFKSIQEKDTKNYISMFGCFTRMGVTRACNGRTRVLDNLQVEYIYQYSNHLRAAEVDYKIRNYIMQFYVGSK